MALLVTLFLVLVNIFNSVTATAPKVDDLNRTLLDIWIDLYPVFKPEIKNSILMDIRTDIGNEFIRYPVSGQISSSVSGLMVLI